MSFPLDPFGSGSGRSNRTDRDETGKMGHVNVDLRETNDAHIFRADLPGLTQDDLQVHVEDGKTLEISGEKVKEEEENHDTWHRLESRRKSFKGRFRLPDNDDDVDIKWRLENGVLNVIVPKNESTAEEEC